jgi:hypothetical protein
LEKGEAMERPDHSNERRRHLRVADKCPMKYWETSGACHGGFIGDVSERGLLIYSIQDMPIDTELNVRVYFHNGYAFDAFNALGRVVWKGLHQETDWEGHKFGIEFKYLSDEDLGKLVKLLHSRSTSPSSPVP